MVAIPEAATDGTLTVEGLVTRDEGIVGDGLAHHAGHTARTQVHAIARMKDASRALLTTDT